MKAILVHEFGSTDVMKYEDIDIPAIQSMQVLIRVEKTSVNFADIKSRYGTKGSRTFPFIPGIDAAGVIVEVGSEVQSLKVGQRVIAFPAHGSYAQYIVADENLTFILPDSVGFEVAGACPIVSFLSFCLLSNVARIEKGETVLIHAAAGGVGTTAVQLAKILGAGTVIGTVGNKTKVATAVEAGADHVIAYDEANFAEKVNELTSGKGVNIVLDSIAGTVTEKSLHCLAPYGRLVQFGNSSGKAGQFKTSDVHASCRSVLGFSLGTTRKQRPELLRGVSERVFQYLAEGVLKIKIGHQFPLSEAAKAHELVENRLSTGKVLLDIWE